MELFPFLANSLWIYYLFHEQTMSALNVKRIQYKFITFFLGIPINSLFGISLLFHYQKRKFTIKSVKVTRIYHGFSLLLANYFWIHYSFANLLLIHFLTREFTLNLLWIHYHLRKITINWLSLSRSHYGSIILSASSL